MFSIFLVISLFHKSAVWTSLEKQLNPSCPIASRGGGSVPVFLRTPIATCNFSRGDPYPRSLSGSANEPMIHFRQTHVLMEHFT